MAMQNRRGNYVNFDPNKMLPGEFAFSLDTGEVYYCIAPGNVKALATKEDLQEILTQSPTAYAALQELMEALEDNPELSGAILADIADLKADKLDKTGDSKDNTVSFEQVTEDGELLSGATHATLFGLIKKKFADILTTLAGKVNKADIVNTDTVNDPTKPVSAAVAYALGLENDALNNNFAALGISKINLISVLAESVPAGGAAVVEIPSTHRGFTSYFCNCSGWSAVMMANVEGNTYIRVRNFDTSAHNTTVHILCVK